MRLVRLVRTFFQKESGPFSPRPVKLAFFFFFLTLRA